MTKRLQLTAERVNRTLNKLDPVLLTNEGFVKLLPQSFYDTLPFLDVFIWCTKRGRYTLPTIELIETLQLLIGKSVIENKECIEIASGMGDISYHLNIKGTDSCIQRDDVLTKMAIMYSGNLPTNPPKTIEKIEALEAVRKYKPKVVLACWATQKPYKTSDLILENSFSEGVDELQILKEVDRYVLVGNTKQHGRKELFKLPHTFIPFKYPSKGLEPSQNFIAVWDRCRL